MAMLKINPIIKIICLLTIIGCSTKPISSLTATANTNATIYSSPNVNSTAIGLLEKGAQAKAIGKNGEYWVLININGKRGWVQVFNLDIDKQYKNLPGTNEAFAQSQATKFVVHAPTPTKLPVDPSFSGCSCDYNLLDCSDFDSQRNAQNCLNYCINKVGHDRNFLDGDSNGVACEGLP